MNDNYKLILASSSPRRRLLMQEAGFRFEVKVKNIQEVWQPDMEVEKVPEYLAGLKAEAFKKDLLPEELVITADTVVCLDNRILGKPVSREKAIDMLHALSGKKHTVITGVCLTTLEKQMRFSSFTDVWFKELSDDEIIYYVDTYHPFDKAGAYGIQEWIGYVGIRRIEGSFYNVMGLPIQQLYETLKQF